MKIIRSLLIIILPLSFYAQRTESVVFDDFNNDKVQDSLHFSSDWEGWVETNISITNGKTQEIFKVNATHNFSEIKQRIQLPKTLSKSQNKGFLEAVEDQLLSNAIKVESPDASLQWILNAEKTSNDTLINPYFNLIINPKTKWLEGEYQIPQKITYIIEKDSSVIKDFLVYYGSDYTEIQKKNTITTAVKNKHYEVFTTSHGVFVKKKNAYKCVFVSDVDITGAPQKLRWESIEKTYLYKNYLIIQQSRAPDTYSAIFIIDIETGICGRLHYTNRNPFIIKRKKIILDQTYEDEIIKLKLKKIIKVLKEVK